MPRLQAKSFATPDDVRTLPRVRFETVDLDEARIGHCRFEPGWRWSTDLGPILGTESCQMRHSGYTVSGSVRIVMELTGLSRAKAKTLLKRADGQLKPAVVMHFRQVDLQGATRILDACNQSLRKAIEDV